MFSPGLNSQAASVGSTRRPISEPRLPWESSSLRDLGDQVSGLLPPTTLAPGGDSADRQSDQPAEHSHPLCRGWGLY
jgi:hypothetical protein